MKVESSKGAGLSLRDSDSLRMIANALDTMRRVMLVRGKYDEDMHIASGICYLIDQLEEEKVR